MVGCGVGWCVWVWWVMMVCFGMGGVGVIVVWDGIGLAVGLASQSLVVRILAIVFFTLPVIFCSTLLPAVLTIVQAIGPVIDGPR